MKRGAAILALLVAGCTGVQSPLNPAGDQAQSLGALLGVMTWVCGVMYLLVVGFVAVALLRSRRRPTGSPPVVEPADDGLRHSLVAWAAIIIAALSLLAIASFLVDRSLAGARSREALVIRVTGHQWWWRLQYRTPGGWVETANELHLPVGRTVRIELGSADVIHSFWVPNVAGKMDVIPGRINVLDLSPHRIGWFRGQCAEFCGLQHAHMAFDVKVESQAVFDAWLANQARPAPDPADPLLRRGMAIVAGGQCAACHTVRGAQASGRAGPDLTHIGGRRSIAAGTLPFSRGALQGWIAQPQAVKPGTMMPPVALDPADADAVARYLESLK